VVPPHSADLQVLDEVQSAGQQRAPQHVEGGFDLVVLVTTIVHYYVEVAATLPHPALYVTALSLVACEHVCAGCDARLRIGSRTLLVELCYPQVDVVVEQRPPDCNAAAIAEAVLTATSQTWNIYAKRRNSVSERSNCKPSQITTHPAHKGG